MTANDEAPLTLVTRRLGERVVWGTKEARVVERDGRGCGACVFWCSQAGYRGECYFEGIPSPPEVGECQAARRADSKDVWFVTPERYEQMRAERRKKREEEQSWREFARKFSSSRLGRAAAKEEREAKKRKKQTSKTLNNKNK